MPRQARPWLRLYSEGLDNRKVQGLPDALFKLYINLLMYAGQAIPRGHLGRIADIAFRLRVDSEGLIEQLAELRRRRLLDGGWRDYQIHDWAEWQPDSDANLTPGRAVKNAVARGKERVKNAVARRREDTDIEKEIETEGEKEVEETRATRGHLIDQVASDFAKFGTVTSGTVQAIGWSCQEHGVERVHKAVKSAAGRSFDKPPPWSYVESMLEGGFDEPRPRLQSNGRSAGRSKGISSGPDVDAWERYAAGKD